MPKGVVWPFFIKNTFIFQKSEATSMRSKILYPLILAVLVILAIVGMQTDERSFLGSLFAAFLSVSVVIFIETELRPQISIVKEERPHVQPDGRRFLRVIVENCALWGPLKLVMDRRPVYQTKARITFLTESNDPVFSEGRKMIARWSNTPEPSRPVSILQDHIGNPQIGFVWDISITRDAVDIGSGANEPLDIVMRSPGEAGCRGWHNRIIGNPSAPPEERFELPKGRNN